MTFGALLTQVGESKLTVAVIVLAFQTGFFWQTIIKQPKATQCRSVRTNSHVTF
jgi:hypothetical protein